MIRYASNCGLPLIKLFCCLCLPLQGLLQTQTSRVLYVQRLGVSVIPIILRAMQWRWNRSQW
eukprot:COSAG02_NODE_591_length_19862_cov_8.047918_3_plen_62_part_00